MTTPQEAAKGQFIEKYLPVDGEMVWAHLHGAGQLMFVPAGARRAHYKLATLPKRDRTMTPIKALQLTGEALFGGQWQSEIGRALGVNDRTVRRWVAGESSPPDDLVERLRPLVVERIALLVKLGARLAP